MTNIFFEFISTYAGIADYRVSFRDGTSYRLHLDTETKLVRRLCNEPIPSKVLEAFNAWRKEKFNRDVYILATKYGDTEPREFIPALSA